MTTITKLHQNGQVIETSPGVFSVVPKGWGGMTDTQRREAIQTVARRIEQGTPGEVTGRLPAVGQRLQGDMNYAEAAYFDGNHCQHVAAYEDAKRLERIKRTNAALVRRMTR